jgi:enamine deaminase RidA (YjgF/YER057c/UK114 family)
MAISSVGHSTFDPMFRLAELGFEMPLPPTPVANFVTPVEEHGLLFLSGQGPIDANGIVRTGKVGADVTTERAYLDAQLVGLSLIAVMRQALGDLRRVRRIAKLFGMVNAVPEFIDHPKVIKGCSDLLAAVFGDAGRHARSAVGMGSLPFGITVEIEAIVAVGEP